LAISEVIGDPDWFRGAVPRDDVVGLKVTDSNGDEMGLEEGPLGRSLRGEVCVGETIHVQIGGRRARGLNVNSAPLRDAHGDITGAVLALQDITEQLRAQRRIDDIYRREHAIAEKLQNSLMPSEFPCAKGFEIGRCYQSALDEALVGGDFYDAFCIGEDQLGIVIADVAGKGLNAAVYTAMTKYMLRAYALEESSPENVLARLNEALSECTPTEVFVTLIYGVLDSKTGVLRYANAGHEQPVFVSARTGLAYSLDVTGRALALARGSTYTACEAVMRAGDAVILYTDGITDSGAGANRMGVERLLETVESNASSRASSIAEAILGAALEFSSGKLADDAAILVIKAVQTED
jgi:sigma-B regulation protein RsbU (phosphoserine phosphatase)